MAFPQGVNFRSTPSYVTDGAGEDYDLGTGTGSYPKTSAQGNTYGFEGNSTWNNADRDSGLDRRLAGIAYTVDANKTWRIDLPSAGSYNVRFAAGDGLFSQGIGWDLFDTTTSLANLTTGSSSGGAKFKDATNTEYSAAAWPGSNTSAPFTFATTICRLKCALGGAGISVMAHFYIEAGAAPADTLFAQAIF